MCTFSKEVLRKQSLLSVILMTDILQWTKLELVTRVNSGTGRGHFIQNRLSKAA
jgi:hypothetical protein